MNTFPFSATLQPINAQLAVLAGHGQVSRILACTGLSAFGLLTDAFAYNHLQHNLLSKPGSMAAAPLSAAFEDLRDSHRTRNNANMVGLEDSVFAPVTKGLFVEATGLARIIRPTCYRSSSKHDAYRVYAMLCCAQYMGQAVRHWMACSMSGTPCRIVAACSLISAA
ncbi:MAG: hypothetical protein ACLFTT_07045 [Candidatus Hydrogenedentota bacterium]